jgi:PAS domain S-box-containing protein
MTSRNDDLDSEDLRASHRRLHTIIDAIPEMLSRFDAEGRFAFVGGSVSRAAGVDPSKLLGRTPVELGVCDTPESDRALSASIARVLETGEPDMLQVKFRLPGGPTPFEVRHLPEMDDGKVVGVIGLARDLSAQQAAARQVYLLNHALDNVYDGIFLMKGESPAFIYVNEAASRSLGYSRQELTSGMGVLDVDPGLNQEAWAELMRTMKDIHQARVESTHRARDGRTFPIEVTGSYFEFEGESYNMAIARDISERRALEQQLRHAQKMEAVGQLAGGVAHDFNNVLGVVQMASSMLLDEAALTPFVREGLLEIAAAAERAARLTRQLLVFSRRQVADKVDLDVGETVRHVTPLLRRLLGEQIVLDVQLGADLPLVNGDPGMLEQVLMNLVINARDATPEGGQITLSVDEVEGGKVCLSVRDSGSGIAPQDLPRIFEPFFTTKEAGKGTGLGLATVFGIVELHHGSIDVQSTVDVGTTFRVFLPSVSRGGRLGRPALTLPVGATGTETILLVEDDPALRATTRSALSRYGYRVLEAETAASALEVFRMRGDEVELLLTDLVMPGNMSGRQLAEKLVAERPSLKVLFTSGYSPDIVNRLLHLAPGQLLQKPYTAAVLGSTVRRCLDATSPR